MCLSTRSTLITTDQNHDTMSRNDRDDNFSSKPEKKNMLSTSKEKHHHPSSTTKKNIGKLKLSKNPGWVEPDQN